MTKKVAPKVSAAPEPVIPELPEPVVETIVAAHTVELTRSSERRLNPVKLESQAQKIIDRALASGRTQKGWACEISDKDSWHSAPRLRGAQYHYSCKMNFTCAPKRRRDPNIIKQDFDNMVRVIGAAVNAQGWAVNLIDGKVTDSDHDTRLPKAIGYVPVEIPADWRGRFTHIYDRDAQIDVIMSCIEAGINSDFNDRFHCALVGDPACGKTETLRAVKAVLGEEAVLEYDATATTQAGAIKDLDMRDELPRILIVEEIEKTDENSLRWLLSVMDHRAEIRKTNYRESIQRETKLLTLATVNDYKLFNKLMFGALASRFAYHLMFPKPTRALLQKILEREVARVKGNRRWIKPTLDFAASENITDPRKVTAICLCGRDQLLDKSYQEKLRACSMGQAQ